MGVLLVGTEMYDQKPFLAYKQIFQQLSTDFSVGFVLGSATALSLA
jgi:hypothetical protein